MRGDVDGDFGLLEWLHDEQAQPFHGWDFSYLHDRMLTEPLPWDYCEIVHAALSGAASLLDVDTGGGEILASLRPLPPRAVATEAYAPNVPVAHGRLRVLGVQVVAANGDDAALPFAHESFDLIINRHGAVVEPEVARLLRPAGRFITQQVGAQNLDDLRRLLGAPSRDADPAGSLAAMSGRIEAAGLRVIRAEEAFPVSRFVDVGAIAYFLKAVPWEVPDFTVERYLPALVALHRSTVAGEPLVVRNHRLLLMAERTPC